MMLRVNDEYLDFNDDIEIEKRVKLFEEIDSTQGDFSYSFELDKTSRNMRILGNPTADTKNKTIYSGLLCDVVDNSGITLYKGRLCIEKVNKKIQCSFFSGNYNWISELSGLLQDIDWSEYDTELNVSNIVSSWQNTEGIIYPLVDAGALITRSYKSLMVEDFTGCIFVKTVFKKVFQSIGVKVQGDLLSDPIFNSMILSRLTIGADDIKDSSAYARKTSNQQASQVATFGRLLFQDDFTTPFFDGPNNNYDPVIGRYTADKKMSLQVDLSIIYTETNGGTIKYPYIYIIRNGVDNLVIHEMESEIYTPTTTAFSYEIDLEAGDYAEIWIVYGALFDGVFIVYAGSTVKYTPTYIYFTTGQSLVPPWTKAQFVDNILGLFCCISNYEPKSKTLTIDLFENIKSKSPIDISDDITIYDTDYKEFVGSFARSNKLSYQESDVEEIKEYNVKEYIKYGDGEINVDNDFIEEEDTILDSDFTAPISYLNPYFSASLDRLNFFALEEVSTQEFATVSDLLGLAQFNVDDSSIYSVGDLVRVSEASQPYYNGDYRVAAVSGGFITLGLVLYESDSYGKITKLRHVRNANDSVYILINTQYRTDNVSQYSRLNAYLINSTLYYDVGYAFFNLIDTGVPINDAYKEGLSFGPVNDPLFYQRTIVDKYWNTVSRVLNDPVKLKGNAYFDTKTFSDINPLRPIQIKTLESTNLYYLNSITGYINSYTPCEVELIKLS